MKKKIPEIKESVEELKEKLKIEKSPRSQQRVHMLYLLKSGEAKSRQEVADLLAVTEGNGANHPSPHGRAVVESL
jgi:hypothetical protein